MNAVFADTLYFLALFDKRDPGHIPSVIASKINRPIITTEFILLEVADGCAKAEDHADFLALLKGMRNNPRFTIVRLSSALLQQGIEHFARHKDKDWSLTDCISFVVMKEHGIQEALTADRNFEQAGFKALLKG